jgi:hypothetical protein
MRSIPKSWLVGGVILITAIGYADVPSEVGSNGRNLIEFFKKAIASPPDIEQFIGSQEALEVLDNFGAPLQLVVPKINRQGIPTMSVSGARAGTNYFTITKYGTNDANVSIVGNDGLGPYQINVNTITYAAAEKHERLDPVTSGEKVFRARISQYLNMGLSDVIPGSVSWTGNELEAVRDGGIPLYGHLQVSHEVPVRLELSNEKEGRPFKAITYVYPSPLKSLSGFPERIEISRYSNGFHPIVAVTLSSIKLAGRPLDVNFFDRSKFITPQITYTNIYSNGDLYTVASGTLLKVGTDISRNETGNGIGNPKRRTWILVCMMAISAIPIMMLFFKFTKRAPSN